MDSDASLVSSRPSSPEPDDLFLPARSKGGSSSGFTGGTVSSSTPSDCPPELSAELRGAMGAAGAHPGDKLSGGGSGFKSSSSSTSSSTSSAATSSTKKDKKQMTEPELQQLRLKINSRERKRMHDLNIAMDGLREVMPYAHGPSVRKLSKIATLLLARNYILMLTNSLEEMKRLHVPGATAAPPRVGHGRRQPAAPHLRRQVSGPAGVRSGEPRAVEQPDWPALGLRSSVARRGAGPWAGPRGLRGVQYLGTEVVGPFGAIGSERRIRSRTWLTPWVWEMPLYKTTRLGTSVTETPLLPVPPERVQKLTCPCAQTDSLFWPRQLLAKSQITGTLDYGSPFRARSHKWAQDCPTGRYSGRHSTRVLNAAAGLCHAKPSFKEGGGRRASKSTG
ncbi:hypothetical protein NN561_013953 [Cricetulus griseus]